MFSMRITLFVSLFLLIQTIWSQQKEASVIDSISIDKELNKILKEMKKKDRSDIVILGHPKSQTIFSLNKIDSFLSRNKSLYQFKTFKNV